MNSAFAVAFAELLKLYLRRTSHYAHLCAIILITTLSAFHPHIFAFRSLCHNFLGKTNPNSRPALISFL